jgi:hypothetical protein
VTRIVPYSRCGGFWQALWKRVRAHNIAGARELLAAPIPREQDKRPSDGDQPERRVLAHPCPCCGGRMIVIETSNVDALRQRPSAVEKAYWPCHNDKMSVTNSPVEFTVTVLPSNRRLGAFTCIEHPGTFAKELKEFVLLHKRISNLSPNDCLKVSRPDGSLYLPEAPSVAEITA